MDESVEQLGRLLAGRPPGLMDATGKYAVLVPLVQGRDGLSLLYEVRAKHMRRQPGEVCFPGGRLEGDESPLDCALREAFEEIGLLPQLVTPLGQLDFIAHRANFIMYPMVGLVDESTLPLLRPSPAEVDEIFLVPLSHLLEHPPLVYDYELLPAPGGDFPYALLGVSPDYAWQRGRETVPIYLWENKAIWGLTGRITRHLVQLIQSMPAP